jgi:hypothetical protein
VMDEGYRQLADGRRPNIRAGATAFLATSRQQTAASLY